MGDIKSDWNLMIKYIPKKQHLDMLLFYNQCIGNIPFYVERDSMPNNKNSQDYKLRIATTCYASLAMTKKMIN